MLLCALETILFSSTFILPSLILPITKMADLIFVSSLTDLMSTRHHPLDIVTLTTSISVIYSSKSFFFFFLVCLLESPKNIIHSWEKNIFFALGIGNINYKQYLSLYTTRR